MKENFDCSQFISFNTRNNNIRDIMNIFSNIEFEIILENQIRNVKKNYFKEYLESIFIELKNDNFIGEFEDWEIINNPPIKINKFIKGIEYVAEKKEISNLKIFLTNFAEKGCSDDEVIEVKKKFIKEGLYSMSKHNYNVWTDNLIMIIK